MKGKKEIDKETYRYGDMELIHATWGKKLQDE